MDTLTNYHPPEADSIKLVPGIASLPEHRVDHIEVQIDPLSQGERFLVELDDEAMDQLASAMALQGIAA